ncbi:telomerase activating protein Est1 [Actinidia rufa]|uniref:Telomerase activating protein Est1 n=1 Tax=Actinidia rufa TaxID=165716 RepID=A0A7J0EDV4_9ERIC|nr:telomerase activating protein Est1 [Actinidia rufa]
MMTIPMDNTPDLSSRERVQRLYNKNADLENRRRKAAQARIPSDPNAWKQMRENYEAIILEDYAFSEQHEIEYALWQLHYRRIEELRALLSTALASAGSTTSQNGKGDLARYKGLYGEAESKTRDFATASSYYVQASSLWPSSGNPHHQLAILASYSGDELVAVYRYFRSLAVENPFSTARDNLIIAFEKNRQSYSQLLGDAKASVKMAPARVIGKGRGKGETRVPKDNRVEASFAKERVSSIPETFKAFNIRFVRINGILFTRTSLETFGEVFSMARSDLLELLASGSDEEYNFGSDAAECRLVIIRLVAVLIFTVHNVNREAENQSYAEILQRSAVLQNAFTAIFDFMGRIVERCFQLNDPSTSYLLPGIMIFVEWLACRQDIAVGSEVEEKQANARTYFWSHCVSFLNKLLCSGFSSINEDDDETCFFNMSRYDESETGNRLALLEDFELRGFLHLLPAQLILDFSRKHSFGNDGGNKEKKARVQRVIAAGKALANVVQVGQQGIYFDPKLKRFVIGVEPQMSDAYSLSCSLELSTLNTTWEENPALSQLNLGLVQPKPQLCVEGEEEDEVIVFKPNASEKHANGVVPKLTSSEVLGAGVNVSKVDLGGQVGSVSASSDGFLLQNCCQYKFKFTFVPETSVPSKLDSIMSSGAVVDSLFVKPSPLKPAGLRKNPVSRPVRHSGPPPGFSSIPPKLVDESWSGATLKIENPPMDDYSWLDGYMLPPGGVFNNSQNQSVQSYLPVSKSNSSMGMVSFPFRGKQVSSLQDKVEKQEVWLDNQLSERLKLFQEQHQFHNGNQLSIALPEQYQGQSPWEGRFFV